MGTVFGKNTTSASITVAGHKVYYIDNTDAEIVEVEDGNTIKYNAFKYSLSGTPYWYVIDGEHDTWTDDLSEWGYSEVQPAPVLPEVSGSTWIANTNSNIPSGSSVQGYDTNNNPVAYDSACVYGVISWYKYNPFNEFGGRTEIDLIDSGGYVYIKNVSSSTINFFQAKYAICSDSTATVVTVYDSSNVAYNAFKFTASNTDYYYVLDGTQTDWTDDLSGIGYRDYIEATYYYYDKSYTNVSNNSWVYLYDNGTTTIPVDDVSKYEFVKYYTGATDTTGRDYGITLSVYNGKLTAINTSGATIALQRVDVRIHS